MVALAFYWRLAIIALLLLYPGYLLVRLIVPALTTRPPIIRLIIYYVVSSLWIALFGLVSFSLGITSPDMRFAFKVFLVVGTVGALGFGAYRQGHRSLRSYLTALRSDLPWSFAGWRRVLEPRLIFVVPFLFSVFVSSYYWSLLDRKEVKRGPWWDKSAARIGIHAEPVPVLQYFIAQNLVKRQNIETSFNLDGNQVWSAGDRPMFVGLTDATLSVLVRKQHLSLYAVHVMLMSSFIFIGLAVILRHCLGLSPGVVMLLLLCLALHPFFLNTIFYTVPKLPGAGFIVSGLALALTSVGAERRVSRSQLAVAGLAFGCGVVCHESCIFGVLFALSYVTFWNRAWLFKSWRTIGYAVLLVAPLVCMSKFQSWYSHTYTTTSDLGSRVSLFLQGSFAYPTPPMTMKEAAKIYFEQYGLVGALEHRVLSLQRGFLRGDEVLAHLKGFLSVPADSMASWFREYNMMMMYTPIATYGIWVLPVLVLATVARAMFWFLGKPLGGLCEYMILVLSVGTLGLFCSLMACYSEVGSPQIPNSLHVFMFMGSLLVILRANRFLGLVWVTALTGFGVCVHYYRDLTFSPTANYNPTLLGLSGACLMSMAFLVYREMGSEPVNAERE